MARFIDFVDATTHFSNSSDYESGFLKSYHSIIDYIDKSMRLPSKIQIYVSVKSFSQSVRIWRFQVYGMERLDVGFCF